MPADQGPRLDRRTRKQDSIHEPATTAASACARFDSRRMNCLKSRRETSIIGAICSSGLPTSSVRQCRCGTAIVIGHLDGHDLDKQLLASSVPSRSFATILAAK
eukprot:gnl/TRDRNA2_/TRDRNA2_162688_c1_seq2.p1 gnl/TRDRNA2_/TRDRNA2_162688_c1~~gnl/TRDRNA2_/TRDRNA2_162688_c1_seq2.p1  ORF type:complete len:113 (-),score=9.11 gnl/TRDRNA2_/TRDRNA2_162688_c1_seq2:104-415(-)